MSVTPGPEAAPAVSVVISVYNGEPYVAAAVKSVLAQTFGDFELIVIDDGSVDGTPAVLDAFTDPRMRVIRQANTGLTKALNRAIAEARGEFIARMDADDLSAPDRFGRQVAALRKNPRLGAVGSWYVMFDEDEGLALKARTLVTNRELQRAVAVHNVFVHGSVMIRRACLERVGGYGERFRYVQDWDLWRRIARHYELENLPEYLYHWRLSCGNIATTREHSFEPKSGSAVARHRILWARAFIREGDGPRGRAQLRHAWRTGHQRLVIGLLFAASMLPQRLYRDGRWLWALTFRRLDLWRRVPAYRPRVWQHVRPSAAFGLIRSWSRRLRGLPHLSDRSSRLFDGIGPGDIAIDCGANVGDVAVKMGRRGATVYAFEPNPYAFAVLQQRVQSSPNIRCLQKAVWSSDRSMKLFYHERSREDWVKWSVGGSLLPEKANVAADLFTEVETVDLSRFILSLDREVSLLKLDIEGAECDVLESLMNTGAIRRVKVVVVETHDRKVVGLGPRIAALRRRLTAAEYSHVQLSWR